MVGDVHGQWDGRETAWFDRSDYDAVLFTGDLPGRLHLDGLAVARRIAGLRRPAVLIPGNHDGPSPLDVLSEAMWRGLGTRGAARMAARVDALARALGPVALGGYSRHPVGLGADAVDVVVARPHAMDGRKLTFAPYLQERFGVGDLASSEARLAELLRGADRPTVVLAHNGPAGFGAGRGDPWGLPSFGRDNGDPDLAGALAQAARAGKAPLAVLTGHMHWNERRTRSWCMRRDGVLYVNAARVPRWSDGVRRHVAIEITAGTAHARLVEVPHAGNR